MVLTLGRIALATSMVPVTMVAEDEAEVEAEVVVVVVENNMIINNHTIHNSIHICHHRRFKGVLVYHLCRWHQLRLDQSLIIMVAVNQLLERPT